MRVSKIFFVILVLFFCFAGSDDYYQMDTGATGTPSCNSSNDGRINDDGDNANSDAASALWRSKRITVGAGGDSLTGFFVNAGDGGSSYNITFYIYSDDGTTNCNGSAGCPNVSLGASYSATYTNIPDARTDFEQLLASTQTLSPGTYHVVMYGGGSSITYGADSVAENNNCNYSTDGSSWLLTNTDGEFGMLGCD